MTLGCFSRGVPTSGPRTAGSGAPQTIGCGFLPPAAGCEVRMMCFCIGFRPRSRKRLSIGEVDRMVKSSRTVVAARLPDVLCAIYAASGSLRMKRLLLAAAVIFAADALAAGGYEEGEAAYRRGGFVAAPAGQRSRAGGGGAPADAPPRVPFVRAEAAKTHPARGGGGVRAGRERGRRR